MPGEVTIDFGIDLGTTNSAIAVYGEGMPQIIKNGDADTTPSCVSRSPGAEWVGVVARQRSIDHPESTFFEFKRHMGTTTTWPLPDGGRVTPEELSASVLRSLREAAFEHTGIDITAAVITVPAAFDTAQLSATRQAGALAGFSYVEALQEPIAAALAYGFDKLSDGNYLVFDLGGGTFDAALVRCDGGAFTVMNHRGDNDLGGGKWDSYIVEQFLLPKLEALGCDVSDGSDRTGRMFRLLKDRAEAAKIDLSRRDSAQFLFAGSDRRGAPLPDGVTMSIHEYEPLIQSDLARAVGFGRDLLAEARLQPNAVAKVILVGGPTRTPALRRAVDSLGIEIASMVDPMTVVARGAALYAAGRARPVSAAAAPPASAVFQLHYEAMVERGKDEVIIGLHLERAPVGSSVETIRVVASDGSWDSGVVRLEGGNALIIAKLVAPDQTLFKLTAAGTTGTPLVAVPEQFTVTRAVAAAPAPVNHSIQLGVDAALGGDGSSTIEIVSRGSSMPVFKRLTVRTTREVSPRTQDAEPLRLLFLEGESRVPQRNLQVGLIEITSDKITRPLPPNSEIEIVVRWEQGQDPKASAYVPFLDQDFSEVLTMKNKQLPDVQELQRQVDVIRARVGDSFSQDDPRAQSIHEVEVRLIDAQRGDAAAAHSAQAQLGPLLDELDKSASAELLAGARDDLEVAVAWARPLIEKYGTHTELQDLEEQSRTARSVADRGTYHDVEPRIRAVYGLGWRVVFRQPGFWIEEFSTYAAKAAESDDPVRAGALVAQGRSALDSQDVAVIQQVTRELWKLFPDLIDGSARSFGVRV